MSTQILNNSTCTSPSQHSFVAQQSCVRTSNEPNIVFFKTLVREMFSVHSMNDFEVSVIVADFENACRAFVTTSQLDYLDLIENEPEIWEEFVKSNKQHQIIPEHLLSDFWDQVYYPAIIFNPKMSSKNQEMFKCWRKFGMEKWYNHQNPELRAVYQLILTHFEQLSDAHYNWFNAALHESYDPWQAWQYFCCMIKPRKQVFSVLTAKTFSQIYMNYFFPAVNAWFLKYPQRKSMSTEKLQKLRDHYASIEKLLMSRE